MRLPHREKGAKSGLGFSVLVEGSNFLRSELGGENSELVEAAVEVADRKPGFAFGGESPIADLGIADGEGAELFLFGCLFLAD